MACARQGVQGTISLRYGDNNVISIDGNAVKMRRHYVQTVTGSTIAAEVKIELENNETIWLTPPIHMVCSPTIGWAC
ncbi:hypothetical protein A6U85_30555 [Agrobacterium sp. 13-626]|jgi:hypothetical protein|nr:hypothetical protein A6U85_30555 [Agrobacterium sp. 13-626]